MGSHTPSSSMKAQFTSKPPSVQRARSPKHIRKSKETQPSRKSARLKQRTSSPTHHDEGIISPPPTRAPEPIHTETTQSLKRKATDNHDLYNKKPKADNIVPEASDSNRSWISAIQYWVDERKWPGEYFQANDQTQKDLERDSWYEEFFVPEMQRILARQKSASSLRYPSSQSGNAGPQTPSDQKPRETKSATYLTARYEIILQTKGSFLDEDDDGTSPASASLCQILLEREQQHPEGTVFRDETFTRICKKIRTRNEARVIQDITRLIVPSAETLAISGDCELNILVESVNEGWNNSIALTKPRPQPDYAVGFGRTAFTKDQLERLEPIVGELTDTSYFMGTYYMYFPFLTCKVKCGSTALDIADRQNAHSMTLAVRAIVELFRCVDREHELHREILAFSISHDYQSVRIYGHYPVIEGRETKYYRYPIRKFDFTDSNGRERWTTYQFTKNVYKLWMPKHFERICSAVNQITPGVNFDVSALANTDEADLQLSQEDAPSYSQQSEPGDLQDEASQGSLVHSQEATPPTSTSHEADPVFKRPKRRH